MQSTSCEMLGWVKHSWTQDGQGDISVTANMQTTGITFMAESEEELKKLLMKMKEESKKASLKLKIQKTRIMASGPIISWQIDGETMETVTDFLFLDSKITIDGDCRYDIKRCLLLGRKVITNLDSILKKTETLLCQQSSIW